MRNDFWALALLTTLVSATPSLAEMTVKLGAPWDGRTVPDGEQCKIDGGAGKTPPMTISGLPEGTVEVHVAFRDKNYPALSGRGGHGIIGFAVSGTSAKLPPVPGMTATMPNGVRVVARAKSTGSYASKGYLPPCSGGDGHSYYADIAAMPTKGKALATASILIGKY